MKNKKNNILSLFLIALMAISIFAVMTTNSIVMAAVDLKTVDDIDENIVYTDFFALPNGLGYGGTMHFDGNITGASIEYSFYGTYISVLSITGIGANYVEVSIDGVVQGEYDTYSDAAVGQAAIFTKADLAKGLHTIIVVSTDKINPKNKTGVNHIFQFDGFVVEANPVIPEKTAEPTKASTSSPQKSTDKTSATTSPQKSTDQTIAKTSSPKNTDNSDVVKSNENNTLIIVLIVVLAGIGVVTFVVLKKLKSKGRKV